jgi:membrane protein DedA with SNARE-associated domain
MTRTGIRAASPRRRVACAAAAALVAAVLVAVVSGLVRLPDLEHVLTELSSTLGPWTYALVASLAFLETGAFVGLVAPGETAIVLGGVVAARGEVDLGAMLILAWAAAALGDLVSFWLGRRLGRRFLVARGPRLGVTPDRLRRVEDFFAHHGGKAILIGRFVGIVRAVAPFLAGTSGMPLRAFLPWSVLGTAVWATTFTLIGYAFSESFGAASGALTHGALALAVVAAAVLALRAHVRRGALAQA